MILTTERLILRPWTDADAESLFEYASDPDVGPIAGWPPHKNAEESLGVIRNVLTGAECYAICEKGSNKAIGAVELKLNGHTDMTESDDECELGYWLGKPFWGRGYMPEAAAELIRHGFEDLGMTTIWCGYYDGNNKSRRVQE
ncbi:MAG: GNAT family N-acetyltransferase, partial [Eubacteriales bacterium]|nr:GNAT family N-acetyltransferase [Eubacteriales bacterium]